MSHDHSVGVVVPVRDRPGPLLRALRSVRDQTLPPDQVVVVDDGSTEPVADLDATSGCATVVRLETSVGPSRARNAGIDLVETEWIAFLDSDDVWHADRLRFAQCVQGRTGADCIVDSFEVSPSSDPARSMGVSTARRVSPRTGGHLLAGRLGPVVTSCIYVRTALARELGFDPELAALEDLDLVVRAVEAGFEVWRTDAAVVRKSISDVRQFNHRRARAARTRLRARHRTVLGSAPGADVRFRLQIVRGRLEESSGLSARLAIQSLRFVLGFDRLVWSVALRRNEQRLELPVSRARDRPSVLLVLPNMEVGGLQVASLRVLEQLEAHHGWDVTLVALRGESATQTSRIPVSGPGTRENLVPEDLRLPGRADRGLRALVVGATRLRAVVDRVHPDVVLSATFECDLVARSARRWLRADGVIHVSYLINTTYEPEVLRLVGRRRWRPLLVRLTDAISGRIFTDHYVAISSAVAESAHQRMFIARDRITVIPRGAPAAPDRVRQPRDDEAVLRLVTGGRLVPQKGFDALVEGVCQAQEDGVAVTLSIFGDGPLRSGLEELAARGSEGSITLHGTVEHFPDRLAAYDVFCLPSRWEGFGNALLEAMHRGMPVVVSDLPVLREVTGGRALRFVAPGSASAWAQVIRELSDLRPSFEASGRAMADRARAEYTVERESRSVDLVLRRLIGGTRGSADEDGAS